MPERKPTRTADLDYFYGQSSELFSFYRIPKLLFQDSRFQPLSTDAKTLYGILLDRMSLSARNGWLDKAGRVFIIYTVQEVQDSLGCADKKATKLLRELEEYGLIERKRRGLGKPDLIYVKNFSSESSKLRFLNRDNDDSGTVQNTLQDPAKLRCNKTKRNNTEMSDTDPIYSDENDWMSEREQLEEYFSQSLEVDLLLRLCPDDEDTIYQIVNLLVDTCATNRKLLHIAGDDKPAEVVRSRFMKLNADHKLKAEEEAKKAAEEAAASGEEQPKENKVTSIASGFLGVIVLIALAAGGGFYAFTKQKQKKQAEKEALDPDANYTEDKGDFEIPVEDEPEETSEENNTEV